MVVPTSDYIQRINQHLSRFMDFTPQELALNRAGMMSQRQQERFQNYLGTQSKITGKIVLVVLAIAIPGFVLVFLTAFSNINGTTFQSGEAVMIPIAIIGIAVSLGLWALMILFGFRRARRFRSAYHQLQEVVGTTKLKVIESQYETSMVLALAGQPTTYRKLRVGKTDFYVSETVAQGFVEGVAYRVYYVPLSGKVGMPVSAEVF